MERPLSLKQKITRVVGIASVVAAGPFSHLSAERSYAYPLIDDVPTYLDPETLRQALNSEISPLSVTDSLIPPGFAKTDRIWEGKATYYSKEGCVGCRADQMMANGEVFNEKALTLAFMRAPLNALVLVENTEKETATVARVTDRGGFEKYGFIADLSLGLRNNLEGNHLTPVKITLLEKQENYSK